MSDSAIHLHPTAPLAERVLLPGDPGRALLLAQSLLSEPRMFNHNRGLWGYSGTATDGSPLTIQATGMGGPSAAIVFSELIALGARRAIRVGTCGAIDRSLKLGDLVVAREAIASDGTSRALGARERVPGDATLTATLERAAPNARAGVVASVDLFYEEGDDDRLADDERPADDERLAPAREGVLAIEMEAATLFALGARRRLPVGCLLAVTDTFAADGARHRIDGDRLRHAAEQMGEVALAALSD